MHITSTNIVVPYTLEDSSEKKNMHFLCEYFKYGTSDIRSTKSTYSYRIEKNDSKNFFGERVEYRGFKEQFLLKEDPIKYNSYTASIENSSVIPTHGIKVYFPMEGMYTYYKKKNLYNISIYIYINNVKTYLYNGIVNSYNNLACPAFKQNGIHYQEYQIIDILDPIALTKELTQTFQVERTESGMDVYHGEEDSEYLINITIQNVTKASNSIYYTSNNTYTGYSCLSYADENALRLVNSFNKIERQIDTSILYNDVYSQIAENVDDYSVDDYVKKVYYSYKNAPESRTIFIRYILLNKYTEDIYMDRPIEVDGNSALLKFEEFKNYNNESKEWEPIITSWNDWTEGMQLVTCLEIYDGDDVTPEQVVSDEWNTGRVISITSNTMAITKDLFKFLIPITIKIDFDKEILNDMTVEDITVYNKIENKSITVNQTSTGSGIIKPVFYRAYDLAEITLHRDMKENICINLDEYKSKTDTFYLKLCGNYFIEYSRNYDGVIFNVNGSCITSNTGTYYICDQDKNFITSGKYKCE